MNVLRSMALAAVLGLGAAACQDETDVRVLDLSFDGVDAFDGSELTRVLATRESGWLPWSTKRYFDRAEFDADLKRILAFYSDRGFPDARLLGVDVSFNAKKDGVRLRIRVDEGAPVVVEDVRFEGFDALPSNVRADLPSLPLRPGGRRDRDLVRTTRDQATDLFRAHGFPQAVVDAGERPGESDGAVIVTYRAESGPALTFGEITIAGLEEVSESILLREMAFSPGQQYDQRLITRTQRRLAGLELFDLVVVTPRVDEPNGSTVPVRVTVSEAPSRRLTLGVGYGTEEQARGTVSWQHLNFMGGAKQATVDAKYSAIDRGLRLGLTAPYLKRAGLSLSVSAGAWWTNQLTYDSEATGGRVVLAYRTDRVAATGGRSATYRLRATYANEYLRYGIRPEFLANHARRDERIALGLDPDTGRGRGTLATVAFDLERIDLDHATEPRLGTLATVHVELASPVLAGTYRYREVGGELRAFVPLGRTVLAGRIRASTLGAADAFSMPFSKRYFLGGSTSLRGWSRFQVSPLDPDGLPIGGHRVVEMSVEARTPLRGPIGLVLFADAGNVWFTDQPVDLSDLRSSAGVGLRYMTPVGALRFDAAKQLTPIDGLVINGVPSTRTWRLHFSIGHSF